MIKNGIAEMYDHTPTIHSKGNTAIYDTKAKMGGYLRNGEKEDYGSISINTNSD